MSQEEYRRENAPAFIAEHHTGRGMKILGVRQMGDQASMREHLARSGFEVSAIGPILWIFDGENHSETAAAVSGVIDHVIGVLQYEETGCLRIGSAREDGTPTTALVVATNAFPSSEFDVERVPKIIAETNGRLAFLGDLQLPVPPQA